MFMVYPPLPPCKISFNWCNGEQVGGKVIRMYICHPIYTLKLCNKCKVLHQCRLGDGSSVIEEEIPVLVERLD